MTDAEVKRALAKQYGIAPKTAVPKVVKSRGMNKTEARRSIELDVLKRAGEIVDWRYEGITLKLAANCKYTPDFAIFQRDGSLRFEETKGGFWRDDARAKIKMAATAFPQFSFFAYTTKKGGSWTVEEFRP